MGTGYSPKYSATPLRDRTIGGHPKSAMGGWNARVFGSHLRFAQTLSIRSTTLDDYFKSGERVDFIKMDVQGYELHALRGARRVVRENPHIKLLLELWPYGLKQAGAEWKEIIELLRDLSMDLMFVTTKGVMPFDARNVRSDAAWYVNLFASRGRRGNPRLPGSRAEPSTG